LKKGLDFVAAQARVGRLSGDMTIDPGGRTKTAERLTTVRIDDLEAHRRLFSRYGFTFNSEIYGDTFLCVGL
jgi:hypothetical protein